MPVRVAIPIPHSTDREYGERAIPQYERAVEFAEAEAVRIPLDETPSAVMKLIQTCDAVLLPGSKADVDPAKFLQERSPRSAAADARREQVDALLLEDAYARRRPVLGICYGLQSLNVFRRGSLIQHIPDFLPEQTRAKVNHEAGKNVAIAHTVEIERESRLGGILCSDGRLARPSEGEAERLELNGLGEGHGLSRAEQVRTSDRALAPERGSLVVPVNSSHHQSADAMGVGLRIVARCPEDGIIEALEGISQDHFVLAVQWHPERSIDEDPPSRALFRAFVESAR